MRCAIFNKSKYGYKPEGKQCKGVSVKKICIPTKGKILSTEITYVRVCQEHLNALVSAKSQAKRSLDIAVETKRLQTYVV